MNLKEIAANPMMRSLWRASKILGCSIFDKRLADYSAYDLQLLGWLNEFDDPRKLYKYQRSFSDPDFEEYWNDDETEDLTDKVDVKNDDEWEEVDLDG